MRLEPKDGWMHFFGPLSWSAANRINLTLAVIMRGKANKFCNEERKRWENNKRRLRNDDANFFAFKVHRLSRSHEEGCVTVTHLHPPFYNFLSFSFRRWCLFISELLNWLFKFSFNNRLCLYNASLIAFKVEWKKDWTKANLDCRRGNEPEIVHQLSTTPAKIHRLTVIRHTHRHRLIFQLQFSPLFDI